jgi:hypothetical protein
MLCSRCKTASVRFTSTSLCEDCWADNAERFHGRDQSVNTLQHLHHRNRKPHEPLSTAPMTQNTPVLLKASA